MRLSNQTSGYSIFCIHFYYRKFAKNTIIPNFCFRTVSFCTLFFCLRIIYIYNNNSNGLAHTNYL